MNKHAVPGEQPKENTQLISESSSLVEALKSLLEDAEDLLSNSAVHLGFASHDLTVLEQVHELPASFIRARVLIDKLSGAN